MSPADLLTKNRMIDFDFKRKRTILFLLTKILREYLRIKVVTQRQCVIICLYRCQNTVKPTAMLNGGFNTFYIFVLYCQFFSRIYFYKLRLILTMGVFKHSCITLISLETDDLDLWSVICFPTVIGSFSV